MNIRFLIWVSLVSIMLVIVFTLIALANAKPIKTDNIMYSVKNNQVSDIEKQKIDSWIVNEKLNPFGDSYDSVYTGGTPLFNETTGEKKDRYLYILEKHPNRPWK